jgi:hypothetical protein
MAMNRKTGRHLSRRPEASAITVAFDPESPKNDLNLMELGAMKTIGRLQETPWQRFVRLQITAARLAQGRGQPKGVFRFATNEACSRWTENLNRNGK